MKLKIASVALVASLTGCSVLPEAGAPTVSKAEVSFKNCMNGDSYNELKENCQSSDIEELSEEKQTLAAQKWDEYLENSSPTIQLYDAIQRHDVSDMQALLDSGADASASINHSDLYGDSARDPNNSTALLRAAADTLNKDVLTLMLDNGADAHWKELGNDRVGHNVVALNFGATIRSDGSDDATITTHGSNVVDSLLDYGYKPSKFVLDRVKSGTESSAISHPAVSNLYAQLLEAADPDVLAEHNGEIQADREMQRKVEQIKQREQRKQRIAAERLDEQKRTIGAKLCKDEQGRLVPITYIGYVERVAGDKVQIRVAQAHMQGSPTIQPSGFEPSIIWDDPREWSLCN